MNDLIHDKEIFLWHLINIDWKPEVSDLAGETLIEWISLDHKYHAVVSLEGDGRYGYTYKIGDQFFSGTELDPLVTIFPNDLRKYLELAIEKGSVTAW